MTKRLKSHLLYLMVDAASLAVLWNSGTELGALWRLDSSAQGPAVYTTWWPISVLAAPLLYFHVMALFELFGLPERSDRLWKLVLRSTAVVSLITLLAGFPIHFLTVHHLESLGYVNCPALERHGRIVVHQTYMRGRCDAAP